MPAMPRSGFIILVGVEIGEFAIGPVMEAGALRALTGRKALPSIWFEVSCDFLGSAGDWRLARP